MSRLFSCYVYNAEGAPQAWCHTPEAAAAIISAIGAEGWTAKWRTNVLWAEGSESQPASQDYIDCRHTILIRWTDAFSARHERKAAKARAAAEKPRLDLAAVSFFESTGDEVEIHEEDEELFKKAFEDKLVRPRNGKYILTAKGKREWTRMNK